MEYVAIILGAIILGIAGIAWDYYKPNRFRTNYRNANGRRNHSDIGGYNGVGQSGMDGDGGGCD